MSNKFNEAKKGSRVGEWADYSYNIGIGCSHDCRYCYARDIAVKNGWIADRANWTREHVKPFKANINQEIDGMVMFPSMHDISEQYLPHYLTTLENILEAGNKVLVVSKPHLACIEQICQQFTEDTDQILFRFTIGSLRPEFCKFWEPGAPTPKERIQALEFAFRAGFQTSVSVEPMLQGYKEAIAIYEAVEPFVTDTVWFGKMQEIDNRLDISDPMMAVAAMVTKSQQSDENILELYYALKDREKVRWKDSIRTVIGSRAS
jgi:DNA repair photolyase